MTDISKYKNVSLPKETYNKIDKIRKVIVPEMTISRSQSDRDWETLYSFLRFILI